MRPQDMVIGEFYRFRTHPNYSYAKCLKVLRAKEAENNNTYAVAKCEHVVCKNDKFGYIRYFRPVDLIKEEPTP
jgi:hypothetical protein